MSERLSPSTGPLEPPAWAVHADALEPLYDADGAATMVLVPSERVLVLTVDLPLAGRRQRLAALPFAIEDRVAEPLEALHVALGPEVSPGRFLAAAVRHDLMRAWVAEAKALGLGRRPLVPDALALPVPGPESWSAALMDGRVRVRAADGSGFAVPEALFASAWTAARQPLVVSYGQPLPACCAPVEAGLLAAPTSAAIDLRQGPYALHSGPGAKAVRRLALAVVLGALAHTAIAATDALALNRIADQRHAQALAALRQVSPGVAPNADLAAAFDRIAPADGGAGRSGFLPLLVRASRALQPFGSNVSIRGLGYAGADRALSLDVEVADLPTLQRVQAALAAAGLEAAAGTATAENGHADGRLVVRDRAGEDRS